MRRFNWAPSFVPNSDDQTVYIVVDDFGRRGRSYRETDVETADLETVVRCLLAGEYRNPVRVVAFNTAEGWSQNVSADIAQELRRRCDVLAQDVPLCWIVETFGCCLEDFVERYDAHIGSQLTLRLA